MKESSLIVFAIGFAAQTFFSLRILIQWFKSEKSRKLESPAAYWVFSILGSWFMCLYGWCRHDFAIIFGQFISYYIYIWNLDLKGIWGKINIAGKILLAATPVVAAAFMLKDAGAFFQNFLSRDDIPLWMVLYGSAGQVIFTLRFVYQYLATRKSKESVLPLTFWIISLIGSACIISYAILRKDPVLILGQAFGFCAYCRNIMIGIKSERKDD